MATIIIDNLDIDVVKNITSITLNDARSVERTDTGISWKGGIQFTNNGTVITGMDVIVNIIRSNSEVLYTDLNIKSQELYSDDYVNITVTQSTTVLGSCLATQLVNALVTGNVGFTVGEATELVTAIVTALD